MRWKSVLKNQVFVIKKEKKELKPLIGGFTDKIFKTW